MTINEIGERVTDWHACKDGPWYPSLPHGGFTHYRIWQRHDTLSWFQRHEWKRADGTTETDDWIIGVRCWLSHAKKVPAHAHP